MSPLWKSAAVSCHLYLAKRSLTYSNQEKRGFSLDFPGFKALLLSREPGNSIALKEDPAASWVYLVTAYTLHRCYTGTK
jgi:hypothetical protein